MIYGWDLPGTATGHLKFGGELTLSGIVSSLGTPRRQVPGASLSADTAARARVLLGVDTGPRQE